MKAKDCTYEIKKAISELEIVLRITTSLKEHSTIKDARRHINVAIKNLERVL